MTPQDAVPHSTPHLTGPHTMGPQYTVERARLGTRRNLGGELALHLRMLSAVDAGVNAASFLARQSAMRSARIRIAPR